MDTDKHGCESGECIFEQEIADVTEENGIGKAEVGGLNSESKSEDSGRRAEDKELQCGRTRTFSYDFVRKPLPPFSELVDLQGLRVGRMNGRTRWANAP